MAVSEQLGMRPAAALVELLDGRLGETEHARSQQVAELLRLHREISGAAVNMNQVAKKANTTSEIPSNFGPTMETLRHAAERVDQGVQLFIAARRQAARR